MASLGQLPRSIVIDSGLRIHIKTTKVRFCGVCEEWQESAENTNPPCGCPPDDVVEVDANVFSFAAVVEFVPDFIGRVV